MSERYPDPFAPSADPERYLPRPASERALSSLDEALREGATRILLHGPPGIGKTLLLRVLQGRTAPRYRIAEASYPSLPCADLCAWVLRGIGADGAEDPETRLLELAAIGPSGRSSAASGDPSSVALLAGREPRPLLLVVDDAHSLPRDTATGLRALTDRGGGTLVLLAVATDGEQADRLREALDAEREVRFDEPLSPGELAEYVGARLHAVGASREVSDRFDADALARLHRESGGLPGRLHHGATALVRGRVPSSDARRSAPAEPKPPPALEIPADQPAVAQPPPRATADARGTRWLRAAGLTTAVVLALGLTLWIAAGREAPLPGDAIPARVAPDREAAAPAPPSSGPPGPSPVEETDAAPADSPPESAPVLAPVRPLVHVNATPWAEIELDGRPVGVTPLAALEVEPGQHRFEARMADGRVLQRLVVVSEGRRHLAFE